MVLSKRDLELGKYLIINSFYSVTESLEHSMNYMT